MAKEKLVPVGIARGDSVAAALKESLSLIGGFSFIRPGQTVLIKPNVNSPDRYPATTNPEVVYELVRLVWERDPKRVVVGDRSWFRDNTLNCMKKSGIYDAAGEAKAEILLFDDGPWETVKPQGAEHWPEGFSRFYLLSQVDHLISVPVVKTHFLATFSMALKVMVGTITVKDRLDFLHADHSEPRFGSMIAELNLGVTPSLVVLDSTKAMVTGGPTSGEVVELGVIIASRDRIAVDVTGLALLKTLGTTPAIAQGKIWEFPQIKRAVELGLGVKGSEEVALSASGVPEVQKMRSFIL